MNSTPARWARHEFCVNLQERLCSVMRRPWSGTGLASNPAWSADVSPAIRLRVGRPRCRNRAGHWERYVSCSMQTSARKTEFLVVRTAHGKVDEIEPAEAPARALATGWSGALKRAAYSGCYYTAFGVTFPAWLVASLFRSADGPLTRASATAPPRPPSGSTESSTGHAVWHPRARPPPKAPRLSPPPEPTTRGGAEAAGSKAR
jgi:hypothetical protein